MNPAPISAVPPCRLCGASRLVLAFHLEHSASCVERLLEERQLAVDRPSDVRVYQCSECGLVQLTDQMPADYYDEYEMAVSFSPRFNDYCRSLVRDFVAVSGLRTGRLIEIGCGDGTFMAHLQEAGFEMTGIEPSARFRLQAIKMGFAVHDHYFTPDLDVPGSPFDGVVSRQVLEHVPDINGFLRSLAVCLAPGAHGMVEVPSLERSIEEGRFFDFFPDHVNYFSASTLRRALESNGLEVIEVRPTFNGEFTVAFFRRPIHADLGDVRAAVATTLDELRKFVCERAERGERTAIWGSGGKGVTALAMANLAGLAYVVDSDSRKHGLYMPVSHLRVSPPERLRGDPVDAVVVTALSHRGEIVTQLRDHYDFRGTIGLLGRTIRVVD